MATVPRRYSPALGQEVLTAVLMTRQQKRRGGGGQGVSRTALCKLRTQRLSLLPRCPAEEGPHPGSVILGSGVWKGVRHRGCGATGSGEGALMTWDPVVEGACVLS